MSDRPEIMIHGLSRRRLEEELAALGQPPFRVRQVWRWLYHQYVPDFDSMKNLPVVLRAQLAERFCISPLQAVRRQEENGPGSTSKALLRLRDGEYIEMVFIPARGRTTLCVSSQVGCKFKCAFCASGQSGFRRSLESGEMVGQVILAARELGSSPSHVVFMGMGEPFDNYDNTLAAVRIINDVEGLSIGARRITISTCGIIPGIERLAGENLQVELSVSLHASDDALRSKLMPVNKIYPLANLLAACRRYAELTGRLITFEYTLIKGVNDSPEQARRLAGLIAPVHCRVNLIMLSPVADFKGCAPPAGTGRMFVETLARAGINATIRVSKGGGINAACGQLRNTAGVVAPAADRGET